MIRIRTTTPRFLGGVFLLVALWIAPGFAQESTPQTPSSEHVFAAKFDEVWNMTLEYLKSRPNPIPIQSAEKEGSTGSAPTKGVISTIPLRYFMIKSATFPPRQQDFRDTYTITVSSLPKGPPPPNPPIPGVPPPPADKPVDLTKVRVERKFEKYSRKQSTWIEGNETKEQAGVSAADLFLGVQYLLTPPPPPPPLYPEDEE